jgi:DNA-binding transcriptional regulator YiaG
VSARIEPDGRTMMLLSLGLVAVLAVASFTLSFLGLMQAASWAGIPEQLRWLVPVVVDATILVDAVAASVQRARGESTTLSWVAVGFFTAVSVAANAAHVLAPGGVLTELNATVVFGAFLASIMPISLFFATETTVKLAVAPVYGAVAQRRRRAAKKLVLIGEKDHPMDQRPGSNGPANGPLHGPGMEHQKDHPWTTQKDHLRTTPKKHAEVDPQAIRDLAAKDKLSQRAIASRLGVSKTTVARILAKAQAPSQPGRNKPKTWWWTAATARRTPSHPS